MQRVLKAARLGEKPWCRTCLWWVQPCRQLVAQLDYHPYFRRTEKYSKAMCIPALQVPDGWASKVFTSRNSHAVQCKPWCNWSARTRYIDPSSCTPTVLLSLELRRNVSKLHLCQQKVQLMLGAPELLSWLMHYLLLHNFAHQACTWLHLLCNCNRAHQNCN